MTFEAIYLGQYRCDPGPARTYAKELRELGKAAGGAEDAYSIGFNLDRREFEGEAGDSFRARCKADMDATAELSVNMGRLSEAADEAALDAQDIMLLLDEMIDVAHGGGLVVSGDSIHPPDNEVRLEDTPALVQGWLAWDRLTPRHTAVDGKYHHTVDDWVEAIAHYGYSEWAQDSVPQGPWIPDSEHEKGVGLPQDPDPHDEVPPRSHPVPTRPGGSTVSDTPSITGGEAPDLTGANEDGRPRDRFDDSSTARWIEGHRDKDGEWVHAHWQPIGSHGHGAVAVTWVEGGRNDDGEWIDAHWDETSGNPHAGEHSTGATTARWVNGQWKPVEPEPSFPSIAVADPGSRLSGS